MIRRTTYHRDELQAAQFMLGATDYTDYIWRERCKQRRAPAAEPIRSSIAWPFKRQEADATNVLPIKWRKP